MTKDKVREVIKRYRKFCENTGPPFDHLYWMTFQIGDMLEDKDDIEKVMRWLGFIQGVLWAKGVYTIDELKEHNRK